MRIGLYGSLFFMLMAVLVQADPLSYDSRGRDADFYRLTDLLEVAMPGDTILVLNRQDYSEVRRRVPAGIRVVLTGKMSGTTESDSRSGAERLALVHRMDVVTVTMNPMNSGTRKSSENYSEPQCTTPGQWLSDQLGGGYYQIQPGQTAIQRGVAEFTLPSLGSGFTYSAASLNFWTESVSGNTGLGVFQALSATAGPNPIDFNLGNTLIGHKTYVAESHGLSGPQSMALDPKALIPGQSNKFILRNTDEVNYCQGGSPSNSFGYVYLQHTSPYYAYLLLEIGQTTGYSVAPNPLPINEPYDFGVFTITASGVVTGTISSISSSTPWIQSVNPTSSILSPNQSVPITVTTDPLRKNYAPGTYQGTVSILSSNGNTDVTVNWQVGNHPDLGSPVNQIDLSDPDHLGEVLTITNSGNVPLNLQSIQSSQNWLGIGQSPAPGTVLSPGQASSCHLLADPEGLLPGVQSATITIGYDQSSSLTAVRSNPSGSALSYNFTMPVTLNIPARYDIQAEPANLSLSDTQPRLPVVLTNAGNTALTWETVLDNGLSLDRLTGSLIMGDQDTVWVGFNAQELAAGNHVKRLVFKARADGFIRDSVVVSVNLTVAPSVRIVSPNGGESLISGEIYPIIYQSNSPDLVFRYSIDNGITWNAAQAPAAIGMTAMTVDTFNWLTPADITSHQCLFKIAMVTDSLTFFDLSDASFSLIESKSLSLMEPNGGEWLFRNRAVPVRWSYTGRIDSLLISLHQGVSRLTTDTLGRVKASDTVCLCPMPDQVYDTAWLKISEIGNQADMFDYSDSFFTLGDTLGYRFSEPQDTTCYMAGNLAVVGWSVQGPPSGVSLDVSYDRGVEFTHLADLPSGIRYYNWTPPLMVRDSVLLRLTSLEYPETSVLSSPFSLIYPVRFIQYPMVTSLTDQACRIEWQTDWPINTLLKLWNGDDSTSAMLYPAGQGVRFHEVNLGGLISAGIYHYRILFGLDSVMVDSSGVFDFTTLGTPPTDTLRISGKPQVLYVGQHKVLIRFMTRGRMNGAVQFTSSNGAHVLDMMNDSPKTIHELTVNNLDEDQLYYFRLGYWDSATQKHHWESETYPIHTLAQPDTLGPVLVWGPFVTVDDDQVLIAFGTDEACEVQLSLDGLAKTFNPNLLACYQYRKTHFFRLTQLIPGFSYRFFIHMTDPVRNYSSWGGGEGSLMAKAGLHAMSVGSNQFTLNQQPDDQPPIWIEPPQPIAIYDSAVALRWETNEPARYRLELYDHTGLIRVIDENDYLTRHHLMIDGLLPVTSYSVRVTARDLAAKAAGSAEMLQFQTRKTHAPEKVTILTQPSYYLSGHHAVIWWKTDLGCDSRAWAEFVNPWVDPFEYTDYQSVQDHVLVIDRLPETGTCYYQIHSADYANQAVYQGSIDSLVIGGSVPLPLSFTLLPAVSYTGNHIVKLIWQTNQLSSADVEYQTEGSVDDPIRIPVQSQAYDHSVVLEDLEPSTVYRIKICSGTIGRAVIETTLTVQTAASADLTPPAVPAGITAELADSLEAIRLTWQSNSEPDFSHYIIWRIGPGGSEALLYLSHYSGCRLIDEDIIPDRTYQYVLASVDLAGNVSLKASSPRVTGIGESGISTVVDRLELMQNHPNPVNSVTGIQMGSAEGGRMQFCMYDLLGNLLIREDLVLMPGERREKILDMSSYPAGIYLYTLRDSKGRIRIRKMAVIK